MTVGKEAIIAAVSKVQDALPEAEALLTPKKEQARGFRQAPMKRSRKKQERRGEGCRVRLQRKQERALHAMAGLVGKSSTTLKFFPAPLFPDATPLSGKYFESNDREYRADIRDDRLAQHASPCRGTEFDGEQKRSQKRDGDHRDEMRTLQMDIHRGLPCGRGRSFRA